MGTRGSFFQLADHAAAREFGRRHYGVFVGIRLLRVLALPLLALAVLGAIVALVVWTPDLPAVPDFRMPDVPVWGWAAGGSGLLVLALVVLRKRSLGFRMFLYRIGL